MISVGGSGSETDAVGDSAVADLTGCGYCGAAGVEDMLGSGAFLDDFVEDEVRDDAADVRHFDDLNEILSM